MEPLSGLSISYVAEMDVSDLVINTQLPLTS